MDPANVSLVMYSLPKEAFSIFESENETLGVNLDELKGILKRCGSKSALYLEKRENFLDISIEDRVKRNFSLNLIDIERDEIDFKEKTERMEFVSSIEIDLVI
jgi:DNA polymerase III sliding clamp (beta) subunit (PCNA family)